ncbi:hypothetical protein ACOMHN_034648 [Nucella lapillus]
MSSYQGRRPPDDNNGLVDVDCILEHLGNRGRYQVIQLMLNIFASFLFAIPVMDSVFTGYQPDYQCSQVDNVTQLADYLPDDVTNVTLYDVQYHQCSIDVTVNTSGTSSTLSLPCVAGVNFSMPSYTSFLTEWSLVCGKAGLSQLSQTAVFGGQAGGYLLFSPLADRFGRKKVYVTCALCAAATLTATALVPSYDLFLVGRIILGFFSVGMVLAAYTMFLELCPQQWRCLASVMDACLWALACVLMASAAFCLQALSWRHLSLALASPFLYALILPWFVDESLRWLLATGKMKEADNVLKKACRMNNKDFGQIQAMLHKQTFTNNMAKNGIRDQGLADSTNKSEGEVTNKTKDTNEKTNEGFTHDERWNERATDAEVTGDDGTKAKENGDKDHGLCNSRTKGGSEDPLKPDNEDSSAKYTVLDLCRHRVVLVPFLICSFVWMTSNLYYYSLMLGSARLSGSRFLNFALLNLQDIPAVLLALFLERRFNRRPLGFFYGTVAGCLLLVSVALVSLGGGEKVTMTLGTVAQYIGKFSLTGSYILLFVYYMEVFPTATRAIGAGTTGMLSKLSNMAAPFLPLWAEDTPWAPGVLLGCLCCLASLSIWLLPETRHRRLPDTVEEIEDWGKKKQPTSMGNARC